MSYHNLRRVRYEIEMDDPRIYRAPAIEPDDGRRRIWWIWVLLLAFTFIGGLAWEPIWYFMFTIWMGLIVFWAFISGNA
jgi:hypothetical protein